MLCAYMVLILSLPPPRSLSSVTHGTPTAASTLRSQPCNDCIQTLRTEEMQFYTTLKLYTLILNILLLTIIS
jgi:hypothetical protein